MAQQRHNLDTTRSMLVIDSGAMEPESTTPDKDNQRIGLFPALAYEAKNVLPTAYGYKSFFGVNSVQDATGLPPTLAVQHCFIYQTTQYVNVLVALTDEGIFMRLEGLAWEHVTAMDAPLADTDYLWTFATIKNVTFLYRQDQLTYHILEEYSVHAGTDQTMFIGVGRPSVGIPDTASAVAGYLSTKVLGVEAITPTTINMQGQLGIFKAGGSLGFWDSEDAVAWSAIGALHDFTPSTTTLANITSLKDIVGRITVIKGFGDGFMVYATKSIIRVLENPRAVQRFRADGVYSNVGVTYPREVTVAQPDNVHFAWTTSGLMQIEGSGNPQFIVPDVVDFIKQTRTPVYLRLLNNRYLMLEVLDPNFLAGNVQFSTMTVDPDDLQYIPSPAPITTVAGVQIAGQRVCFTPDSDADSSGIKPYVIAPFLEGELRKRPELGTYHLVPPAAGAPALIPDKPIKLSDVATIERAVVPQAGKLDTTAGGIANFIQDQIDTFNDQQTQEYAAWPQYDQLRANALVAAEQRASDLSGITQTVTHTLTNNQLPDGTNFWEYVTAPGVWLTIDKNIAAFSHFVQPPDSGVVGVVGREAYRVPLPEQNNYQYEWQDIRTVEHEYFLLEYRDYNAPYKVAVYPIQINNSGSPTLDRIYYVIVGLWWDVVARCYPDGHLEVQSAVLNTSTPAGALADNQPPNVVGPDAFIVTGPPSIHIVDTFVAGGIGPDTAKDNAIAAGYNQTYLVTTLTGVVDYMDPLASPILANRPVAEYNIPAVVVQESHQYYVRELGSGPDAVSSILRNDQAALESDLTFPDGALAGLLAADTWWYSTNRQLTALDRTALVTPTLPLSVMEYGFTQAMSSVVQDGNFANRYFQYTDADGNGVADSLEQRLVCGLTAPIDIPPIDVYPTVFQPWTIEIPPLTWQLENGSRAPVNPTIYSALVYDTQLQKWGNMQEPYKVLVDYQPVSGADGSAAISYKNFVVDAGAILPY